MFMLTMIQCSRCKNKCFLQKDTIAEVRDMNIAILGFGTIGSGVYEIIESKKSSYLYNTHVVKVLDLPQNKDKLSIILFSSDTIE